MIKKKRNRKSKYPVHVNVRISANADRRIKARAERATKKYADAVRELLDKA